MGRDRLGPSIIARAFLQRAKSNSPKGPKGASEGAAKGYTASALRCLSFRPDCCAS